MQMLPLLHDACVTLLDLRMSWECYQSKMTAGAEIVVLPFRKAETGCKSSSKESNLNRDTIKNNVRSPHCQKRKGVKLHASSRIGLARKWFQMMVVSNCFCATSEEREKLVEE